MARNLVVRLGLDPSGYNAGMSKLPKTAEATSKKVKKALSSTDIASAVNEALGTGGNRISEVTSANVDQARQQLQLLTEQRNRLREIGFDDNTTDVQYGAISERIQELTYDISAYEAELERQAQAQLDAAQAAQDASQEEVAAAQDAASAYRNVNDAVNDTEEVTRRSIHPIRTLSEWLRSLRSSGNGIEKVSDRVRRIGSSAKSSRIDIGNMVSSLRRVALVSFAFRIAGAAMGRLRSIVSEYISDNAVLQAQVNGLKAGMGQALAPAINLVTNAMSALMPYILGVSNAIGQLMTMLFGSGWTAAADGANKTAAATGGAAKAQKELNRQLMSFDEINKLSASTDSSGGGGSSGTGTNITPIESKTPAWLERFKTSFSDLFSSEEFQAANIGGKIGMSLQAGLDWLGSEAMHFDWSGAGRTLRENFDSFMGSGWVDSLFHTIGIGLGGFADFVLGVMGPQWEELKAAYDKDGALGAAAYIGGFIAGIPGALANFVFSTVFGSTFEGLADYFREKGNDSVADFLDGIANGMKNIGPWLKENFVDALISSLMQSLGFGPSALLFKIGSGIVDDLTSGISSSKHGVDTQMQDLKKRVFSASDEIKNAFSFEWKMPTLRTPHLSLSWEPVDNVVAKFFGVSAFPHLNVSWYAKGGILDGAQIFGRMGSTLLGGGERGREAVLPLEQNTDWMDTIAEKVVSLLSMESGGDVNATIYLTLDGDVLDRWVIKGLRRRARATGGQAW